MYPTGQLLSVLRRNFHPGTANPCYRVVKMANLVPFEKRRTKPVFAAAKLNL
jgi:hypothetical protein